ncbi:MAG: hypothetical protein K9K64_11610 [Desulfohalobiaceae bacterium]|nr:hypothetical protein [Desulfohalobiaceae bacterium]
MNKEEYIEMLEDRIAGLNERLEKLQLQAKLAEMEYREDLQSEIKRFQAKRDEITEILERMQKAGEGAWGELRKGAEQSFEAMKDALQKAKSHIE